MSYAYGFSIALLVYLLAMCVILLFGFIFLRRRIRALNQHEIELKESLGQKLKYIESRSTELETLNHDLGKARRTMKELSAELELTGIEDPATHVASSKYFEKYLKAEWRRAYRFKRPISLVIVEIDFYANYADAYGAADAELCLRKVALNLRKASNRSYDLVARIEDTVFGIILPETSTEGAMMVAERMRRRVEALGMPNKYSPKDPFVTISCGLIALIPQTYNGSGIFLEKAKDALIRARAEGCNCVRM